MGGLCSCFRGQNEEEHAGSLDYTPGSGTHLHCFQFLDSPRSEAMISMLQKVPSQCNEASELRQSNDGAGASEDSRKTEHVGCSKKNITKFSVKQMPNQESNGFVKLFIRSHEECPTCLEEYTSENPKIILKCSHDFHLSCIYEWMERSSNCPFCGKVMLFNE